MSFVLPATSSSSQCNPHLAPQLCEYPDQGYYHLHPNVPRFAVPPYPASQQRFFHQPSAEELEERGYQRALAAISNHHHSEAEKEAAIRRHRQADAVHQQYLTSLTVQLERQRRQQEFLVFHNAEVIRTQQARARLAAAERQLAVNEFLGRSKGTQPVRRQPHLAKLKLLPEALRQRLASGFNANVTEPIQNVLSSLGSRPVHSDKLENSNEYSAKLIENFLSSLLPAFVFHVRPAAETKTALPKTGDDEESEVRAVDTGGLKESARNPQSADVVATNGSSNFSPVEETVTETEQTQADRATALSSIEHARNNLAKFQTNFVLPIDFDHYASPTGDHDETDSVSSTSSELTKLIPYTNTNKPAYKYEHELNRLLEEVDGIESHGDTEVRDKRKEVVKAIERALEAIKRIVGNAVEGRLSLVAPSTPVTEGSLKGFGADGTIVEESSPVDESFLGFNTPPASDDATTTPHVDPSPTGPDSDVPAEEEDTVDAFLLNAEAFPPSPVKKHQSTDADIDDDVVVVYDDVESDWSDIED